MVLCAIPYYRQQSNVIHNTNCLNLKFKKNTLADCQVKHFDCELHLQKALGYVIYLHINTNPGISYLILFLPGFQIIYSFILLQVLHAYSSDLIVPHRSKGIDHMSTQAGVNVISCETPHIRPLLGLPGIIAHQLVGRTCGKLSEQCPHEDSSELVNYFASSLIYFHIVSRWIYSNS